MRNRFTRILLFAVFVVIIGYLFNLFFVHFSGDGKDTPEQALPKDADYEWIEGPKTDKEHRYFFLSNGNYFGTGVVTKNLKGWNTGKGSYSKLPNPLEDNTITSAHSDSKILFGLIKPKGDISVKVNGTKADLVDFSSLDEEVLQLYNVKGYSIWYIDKSKLEDQEKFSIQVLDENDEVLSELSI
ncbi:hypothetical protein SAMN05880501_104241 [Ureibacillus xyleni]|uniref:Uncharacterized protein n=1 Tax=Ureibacillus xyleni TaxID=614648 RepID=A0A285SG13_9BACL|nr:hypothetical protein [Ureibacillus xyleni]SOC06310.1 hypothetical protein SAMN05880501_104241 [Ureibacillus xyleni]